MRRFLLALAALAATVSAPLHAREMVTVTVTVEEWVEAGSSRFVAAQGAAERQAIASYGPFRVLDGQRAALVDVTDTASPAHFAAMLRDYPALATLEMVECPGTEDDRANLAVGRMIRAAGVATHVPAGGSVRSGAVELFLAGASRRIDDGAEFAVHAWIDEDGREAGDFAADAPIHAPYLAYYREMGMDDGAARAFYAMTNSVRFADAKWLDAGEMRKWVAGEAENVGPRLEPRIAYLDLARALP
ncbi:alpha/beta hydrolase [Pelagerythrobacter sp.]|uniref:alpha/beta hydrolase n=1 Tax=Pelagerythrobacter sp. TaxID=2800702 RepID=UPI0035B1C47D